jgi:fatty acid desaturase
MKDSLMGSMKKRPKPSIHVTIDGQVYNITDWVNVHPGGREILARRKGKDVSDLFHAFHPFSTGTTRAFKVLEKLPRVPPSEHPKFPRRNSFQCDFQALRNRIEAEGLYNTDYVYYCQLGLWLVLLYGCTLHLTLSAHDVVSTTVAGLCMGLFFQQCAFVGHDAGHCAITHDPQRDAWIGTLVGPLMTGVSMDWWKKSHNAHHISTNHISHDPDIQHMPLLAIAKGQLQDGFFSHYHNRHFKFDHMAKILITWQAYTFLPLMALARWNLYLQSLQQRTDNYALTLFWAWFTLLTLSVPSWKLRFLFITVSHASAGILHLQIVLSHFSMPVHDSSTFDAPPAQEFFRHQCATCLDLHSSWINDWFYGGLQYQLPHHLFPRVPRHNLRRVQFLVHALCKERGVDYHIMGWWAAIRSLFSTLNHLSSIAQQA